MTNPSPTALVRPARAGDEPDIARVHVASWQDAYRGHMPADYLAALDVGQRTEAWRRRLPAARRSRGELLVAVSGPDIVGFAHYGPSRDEDADPGRTGEIGAIYLQPESIGQGIGRLLMERVVAGLAGLGYADATLWVLDGNTRARRFYERAGWAPDGAAKTDQSWGSRSPRSATAVPSSNREGRSPGEGEPWPLGWSQGPFGGKWL